MTEIKSHTFGKKCFLAFSSEDYHFNYFKFFFFNLAGASRRLRTGTSQGQFSHTHGSGGR